MYSYFHVSSPSFLYHFNENNFLDNFFKYTQISNLIIQWGAELLHADGRQMDTTKLTIAFRNFTDASKNDMWIRVIWNMTPYGLGACFPTFRRYLVPSSSTLWNFFTHDTDTRFVRNVGSCSPSDTVAYCSRTEPSGTTLCRL